MKPLILKLAAAALVAATLSGCAVYETPAYYQPAPAVYYAAPPPVMFYDSRPGWYGGYHGHHWR